MLSLLLIHISYAVPLQFNHQGRLLDLSGDPIGGEHELVFRIYDESINGTIQWEESIQTEFTNGYYSVNLGEDEENNPLDSAILANYPLWIELTIDEDTMEPRYPMLSVPYSSIAGIAESVEGGFVDADEVSVNSNLVIDSGGNWVGEPINWNSIIDVPAELIDGDENTQLSETEVENYIVNESVDLAVGSSISGNAILTTADTLTPDWNNIQNRPNGLDDGDDNTQLSETEVENYIVNESVDLAVGSSISGNAILTTADTLTPDWNNIQNRPNGLDDGDDNTQLSEADVENYITNNSIDFNASSTIDNLNIVATEQISCSTGDILVWDGTIGDWFCETDPLSKLSVDCLSGQILKWNENNDVWECQNDIDTDTNLSSDDVIGFIENASIINTGTICDSNGCIGDKQWSETGSDIYFDSGNVGIGVTNPTSPLEVSGVIESTSGGIKFPDGTTQITAATGYVSIWTYQNSSSTSFNWQNWVNDRLAEGVINQGSLYECNMSSSNGAHYSGYSFKLAVNLNSSSNNYNQHHRIFSIEETNSGWVGGCGSSFSTFDSGSFTYLPSLCTQSIDCRCIQMN